MYFTELLRGVPATNLFPQSFKFNLSWLLCTEMGPLNISPLPTGMMLSIIMGGHCRDLGGGRAFPPSFSLSHSAVSWSMWSFQYQSLTGNEFSSIWFLQCAAASRTQQPPSHPNTSLHNIGAPSEVPEVVYKLLPPSSTPRGWISSRFHQWGTLVSPLPSSGPWPSLLQWGVDPNPGS